MTWTRRDLPPSLVRELERVYAGSRLQPQHGGEPESTPEGVSPRLDNSPAVGRGRHADRLPRVDAAPPRGGRVARMG